MNRISFLAALFCTLLLGRSSSFAGTQRIVVVGDSWAALMTHPIAGKIFDTTLAKNGFADVEIVATEETAVPGSRADQWASNHKGKLDNLKKTLAAHPTVDVVFVVIGGNDFLKEAIARNLSTLSADERNGLWKGIAKHVETLVDTILACRPNLKVMLCDYDYLNLAATAQSPMKQTFQGISQSDFNRFLVDLGREKRSVMAKSDRCLYIQNWGLMQHSLGDADSKYEPKTVPLPGGPPRYDPFPGGDPEKPGPAQAFNQGPVNDGIHLNAQGYRLIIENALSQGLGRWLKEGAPRIARAVSDKPLLGFNQAGSEAQRALEARFDAALNKDNLRAWMKRMSARPHHVGSPFGKEVAEFIADQFRGWGFETEIEEFQVLFPTPKSRTLEMLEPEKVVARLAEPELEGDTTSGLVAEQLPNYNAYSIDGDVTGKLVYANYGVPKDYETLAEKGIDVRGKIVITRYGGSWRGIKPKVAAEHGAIGCLIYSDPRDDGYFEGDVYPGGAWRSEHGAQRGSVADIPLFPGDPLTPGIGSTKDAKRLLVQNAPTLTKIPVLPISYADALPLLRALQGPVAPEAWRGALPITYHLGPGPATVRLKLEFEWKQVPAYDVIARLRGAEQPEQWIIQGNHHDAWVFGAADPLSGLVALMEEARVIGQLAKDGWRPKRTIVFAAWDAEEPGLLGSTEWVETHADLLRRHAAVYINGDNNGRGFLRVSGSHTLERFVNEIARDVIDPQKGISVGDRLRAFRKVRGDPEERREAGERPDLRIAAMGSGSDYSPFLQHLGIASLDIRFGGEDRGGSYHSIYDSFDHYVRFGDPDFAYGLTLAQTSGRALLRLANAAVLPFEFVNFYETATKYAREVAKLADDMREETRRENQLIADKVLEFVADPKERFVAPKPKAVVPFLNFAPLQNAIAKVESAAREYDAARARFQARKTPLPQEIQNSLDEILLRTERALTREQGLPRRPWYRHHIYAPGFYTGYGVKTLPGVREAIEQRNWSEAGEQIVVASRVLESMAAEIERAVKTLAKAGSQSDSH